MITTNSEILNDKKEGLVADQCLSNFDEIIGGENPVEKSVSEGVSHKTVAIPSHQMMVRLLHMFAGRKSCIAEGKILEEKNRNSEKDDTEVEKFVKEVIQEEGAKETYDEFNQIVRTSEQTAIISDNSKVSGTAFIPENLFCTNLVNREVELAFYIRKTFGAEGLRHFLGIIIGLEENGRKGKYRFTMNEHLQRLGYTRSKGGAFDPALKKKAFQIIQILCSLHLTIKYIQQEKPKIVCVKLFSLDRFDAEGGANTSEIAIKEFTVQANDEWYGSAFRKTEKRSQQYTKLLRRVAFDNHGKHPFVLYLAAQFAIRWRMNAYKPFRLKLRTIMEMCDLDATSANRVRMRDLAQIEKELNYMVLHEYLGSWQFAHSTPARNRLDWVVILEPPLWLSQSRGCVGSKKESLPIITVDGLRFILRQTGLNQSQVANNLNVSRQHISNILQEKIGVSKGLSRKIVEVFGYLFEEVSTKPCPACSETLPDLQRNPALGVANEKSGVVEATIHRTCSRIQ